MEKVNKKSLLVLVAAIMLLSVFAVSYAFFRYAMDSNTSAQNRAITARVTLDYTDCATGVDDCKEINASLKPGDSVTKTFKVENTGNVAAAYSIYFAELQNSFLHDELTYKLEDITNVTPVTVIDTTPVPYKSTKDVNIDMLTYAGLGVNETKEYRLTITFTNADRDQSDNASATFDIKLGIKEEIYHAPVAVRNIYCVNDSNEEITCPSALSVGQKIAIGRGENIQYFRYVRTTDTSNTINTYNECQDGGADSIACTDVDSRHPLENNQLRLLAEYNLYVGGIYDKNSGRKISDIDTTSATYGKQDSTARGWVFGQNMVGSVAYGASNTNYSQSNVKTYTDNYANYLNTTYFSGSSEVSGSAITLEELKMLGCDSSNWTCDGAPNWVYTSSYWTGSPGNADNVLIVTTNYAAFGYEHHNNDFSFGVRPVIMIDASELQ